MNENCARKILSEQTSVRNDYICWDFISDKKSASQPKKKGSGRRHKAPLTNGKVANGVTHLNNGSHSRAALNSSDSQEGSVGEPQLNGHHKGNTFTHTHTHTHTGCVLNF